jgi:hypothetical protein
VMDMSAFTQDKTPVDRLPPKNDASEGVRQ